MERTARVFHSFEEADQATGRERRSMTPEQRVEVLLALQQSAYRNASDERLTRVYRVLKLEQS